ncbi:hypothetical protein BL254_11240 [Protofrankia sp. BMG5.30]|nr:hypothetical protein BL254_11240 [Protofrankia sp. BMG5.30]
MDTQWAEWIAWTLEEAGHDVLIQAWDFAPGSHFVAEMQQALDGSRRTIVVLSRSYLTSVFATEEWQAVWASNPAGSTKLLMVMRVADCDRPGLLRQIVSVDLFGVTREVARQRLLEAVGTRRRKPTSEPSFPAGAPVSETGGLTAGETSVDSVPQFPPAARQPRVTPSPPGVPAAPPGLSEPAVHALAAAFPTPVSARQILETAGLDAGRQPGWNAGSSLEFWRAVSSLLAAGVLPAGRERLLAAARQLFPANPAFAAYVKEEASSTGTDL